MKYIYMLILSVFCLFFNINSKDSTDIKLNEKLVKILEDNNFYFKKNKEPVNCCYFYKKEPTSSEVKEFYNSTIKKSIEVTKYTYDSKFEVDKIFKEIDNSDDKSQFLTKDFVIVIFEGNTLFTIDTGCNFSTENWENLIKSIEKIENNKIICYCGWDC